MKQLLYGVIGKPVLQSRSPELFRAAFSAAGIEGAYLRLAASSAAEALSVAEELKLDGLNVTAPFKAQMHGLTVNSLPFPSVNTVKLPTKEAVSTDGQGVVGALGGEVSGKRILVIGAGGSAQAAISGLSAAGAKLYITNRTMERAVELSQVYRCEALSPEAIQAGSFDVIINTVPDLLFPLKDLPATLTALDAIYHFRTPFSEAVEKSAARLVAGEEWLLHQGVRAIEFLTGILVEADSLRRSLHTPRPRPDRINLIGMMGSGKSTLGPLLAKELGYRFIEQDKLVEQRGGATIREMVLERGEPTFRILESEILGELADETGIVVATGGGVVKYCPEHLSGLNVWLHVGIDRLAKRLQGETAARPLLAGTNPRENLERIWQERRFLYAKYSDLVVPEDRPESITKRICEEISQTWKS